MTDDLKIVTWNVNSIKARGEHVEKFLETRSPDMLMVQELKGETFDSAPFDALGYDVFMKGQKAYNGVAVFAKKSLSATLIADELPRDNDDNEDEQARFLDIEVSGVRYINIYLPNGNPTGTEKYDYKLAWMDRLHRYATDLIDERVPFLIGGDFNVIPEDKDCHDPKAWEGDALFRPETHAKFRALKHIGLYDAFRMFNRDGGQYSFWDYQRGAWQNNHGIRIDHFLLSPALTDRAISCAIDTEPRGWERPSDHTPVILTLGAA